jgi:hypothetical protein
MRAATDDRKREYVVMAIPFLELSWFRLAPLQPESAVRASVSGTLSHITAARKIAVSARSPAVYSRITLPRMLMGQAIRKINWAESTFIAPISWNLAVTNAEAMAATDGTSDQPAQFRYVERLGDGEEALMV